MPIRPAAAVLATVMVMALASGAAAMTVTEYRALAAAAHTSAAAKRRHDSYLAGVRDALIVYSLELAGDKKRKFCFPQDRRLTTAELRGHIDAELKRNARVIRKYPKLEIALVALLALGDAYPCGSEPSASSTRKPTPPNR
jgi:hypothetical protein